MQFTLSTTNVLYFSIFTPKGLYFLAILRLTVNPIEDLSEGEISEEVR